MNEWMILASCSIMKSFGVDGMPSKMRTQAEEGLLRNLNLLLITHQAFRKRHTNSEMNILCFT